MAIENYKISHDCYAKAAVVTVAPNQGELSSREATLVADPPAGARTRRAYYLFTINIMGSVRQVRKAIANPNTCNPLLHNVTQIGKSAPHPLATSPACFFGGIEANPLIPRVSAPHILVNRDTIGVIGFDSSNSGHRHPKTNSLRRDTMRQKATQIAKIGRLLLSPTPRAASFGGIEANSLIPKIRWVRLSSFFPSPNAQQCTTTHKRAQLSEISKRAQSRIHPRYAVLLALAAMCQGAQPVQLTAQPQKFRTFYSLSDPRVPPALQQPGQTLRASASDGAGRPLPVG
jgi:hypothetical protein